MFKKIDFSPGKINYDSFDVKPNTPYAEQTFELREDLFQVSYDNNKYIIDIGWFPNGNPKGKFSVSIIKDYDWNAPLYRKRTNDLSVLDTYVAACAAIVRDLLKNE